MAFAVARRTNEIGIRIALGARGSTIVGQLLRSGLSTFGFSSASAFDGITYVITSVLLLLATLSASFVPAYRAARIDPAATIKYE